MSANSNKIAQQKWQQEQIAKAIGFSACMFVGLKNGVYDTRHTKTLEQARLVAKRMIRQYGCTNSGRSVMIYARTEILYSLHVENVQP